MDVFFAFCFPDSKLRHLRLLLLRRTAGAAFALETSLHCASAAVPEHVHALIINRG